MNDAVRSIAEQCSQPHPSIHESALLHLRPYIEEYLDADWLKTKLEVYQKWASKNSHPLLQSSLLHRPIGFNMLAACIWVTRDWENTSKEKPSVSPPMAAKRLGSIASSLAVLELQAGSLLDSKAREHLQQRLQATDQLWGVINELYAYNFFHRRGAKVQPHFLQKASPREITAKWNGVGIPVQCKVKHPGAGRLISQDMVTTLACYIARDARAANRKLLVRIGTTGSIRRGDIEFLRNQVSRGAGSGIGPALVTHDNRLFTVRSEPLSGRFTSETIQTYLSSFTFHVGMVIGEPVPSTNDYDAVAVVGVDSSPSEKPWRSLKESIIEGAKQLRNGPPGIIVIYYTDPVSDFEALSPKPGYLRLFVGQLLDNFAHVGAVIMTSEPSLQLPGSGDQGQVKIIYRKPWPFPSDFLPDEQS